MHCDDHSHLKWKINVKICPLQRSFLSHLEDQNTPNVDIQFSVKFIAVSSGRSKHTKTLALNAFYYDTTNYYAIFGQICPLQVRNGH